MTNNKKFFNKKLFYTILILLTSIFFIHFTINFLLFPREINIIAGNKHKLDFNIPVVATILSDDKSIFNINDKPLNEEDNINLKDTIYIQSDFEGSHNMRISLMGIPVKNIKLSVLPNIEVVPSGISIGVRINTDGVMVLGLGAVKTNRGEKIEPANNILKSGDMILEVNNQKIDSKETLIDLIENNSELDIKIKRKEEEINLKITPVQGEDGVNKIGVWVRDSTQGIGTLTYFNNDTKKFGALGHGIADVDTKEIMKVKDGKIMRSNIIGVKRGEKGTPGELLGEIKNKNTIGKINSNTHMGIYGEITDENFLQSTEFKSIPIGLRNEVEIGDAKMLSNIDGTSVKEYDIQIENINKYNMDSSKSMIIRIVDEELIKKTNGIVQGMSGSPIIQNGKIIGAVTHVFVNEPQKGYGIFIENMIKNE